jgi:succinoglycan biosynthesis protein ExoA
MNATVSVIVPIRNEARSIESTLRSLLTQEFPRDRFDVIVADGGSTDDTVPRVRKLQREFPNLRLTFNANRFSSSGRNLGLRHLTGDYAVIVDGHCAIPDRQYLTHLVAAFESSGADCLGRPQPLDAPNPTPFQRAVSVARASRIGHNPDSDVYSNEAKFVEPQNTAVAYRTTVLHRVGLFDGSFDACEDVEYNQRVHEAGLTCFFTPTLKIMYHPRSNWLGLFTQLARYGAGRARLAKKHPRSLTLPALVPPLWLVWLLAGFVAGVFLPPVRWMYLASVVFYCGVILGASIWLGRKQPFAVCRRIPGVFCGIHFGFAYGFLTELVRTGPRRPAK